MLVHAIAAMTLTMTTSKLDRFEYSQIHMGVRVSVAMYAPDAETAQGAARAVFEKFAALEEIMSDYRADSEIMRLCAATPGESYPVSEDLFRVLDRSQDMSKRSGGAFDVTVGPLVRLWREARKTKVLPSPESLTRARDLVGWGLLHVDADSRTVRLDRPGMRLDLGGIAKGYACERWLEVLSKMGIDRAMIEAGGDIAASGAPPGKLGWRIDVQGLVAPLYLKNQGISTSGDANQFVVIGGKRYSHILDPATGLGLTDRKQVTVLAPDATTSDSLATACSVLGDEQGRILAEQYGAKLIAIVRAGSGSAGRILLQE